ncbi:Tellurite resistance, TerY [Candidatus Thiomargarita nelsonii]|uniref:Tellurite resistance, TerY n=1 Tax=Candidatus Thiomargarita nelsonii TaxID=1003181 RepID=A0A176S3J0_9GAMM|nr:Tellurite resistance, TerY [Candidatus Thiomargarita nelsonii]
MISINVKIYLFCSPLKEPLMSLRRLPVYLLLDCSSSMRGQPIEQVKQGLRALLDDLSSEPMAIETVYLSVITFHNTAQQVIPLMELMEFKAPQIQASGATALGAALRLLMDCLEKEVRKNTEEQKGDWKPLVFLMTDGMSTDAWENAADELKKQNIANLIAFAAGSNALVANLKRMTDTVLKSEELSPGALKAFFQWMSQSILRTGRSVQVSEMPVDLPPPPPQIQIVP